MNNRFASEGGRPVPDVLKISNSLDIEEFLMTANIKKAFDSQNHSFCLFLKNRFWSKFVKWIKISIKTLESCSKTTLSSKLETGTRQGHSILEYLFILTLEVIFALTNANPKVKGLPFNSNNFLYSAYTDESSFSWRNDKSLHALINTFDTFSLFPDLKINIEKSEIAGTGVKNGVKVALCGMVCIDVMKDIITILGIYLSYNKKLEQEKNFLSHIVKIQNILKLCKLRNLIIEGRIANFKLFAISNIIHLALVTEIPISIINLLYKIEMEFIWKGQNPKIKHSTLCNEYKDGGLKNVHAFSKGVSLKCSRIKRLFHNNFHQWKLIPFYLVHWYLEKNFKFHSNLEISHYVLENFPKFYQELFFR